MIEAFSTDAADQAFNIRILPWRAVCGHHLLNAHVLDPLPEELAVDRIQVADQESRRRLFGECLDDLLSRPPSRRIRRDVEMDDRAAVMSEDHETEQDAKRRSRDREEVDCHDSANVVVQESPPRL